MTSAIRTIAALFRPAPPGAPSATTQTAAERLLSDWADHTGPLVRDALFRETATRSATWAGQTGPGWMWRFGDGSMLVANEAGVVVR